MKGVFFLIYLFIEVFVTVPIASEIGVLYTFLVIIFSGIVGIFLLFSVPFKMAEMMNNVFAQFSLTAFGLSTFLRIFGAFMLILPGFFGDMIGIILVIGSLIFAPKIKPIDENELKKRKDKNNYEEVIDVEIVEDNSANHIK